MFFLLINIPLYRRDEFAMVQLNLLTAYYIIIFRIQHKINISLINEIF